MQVKDIQENYGSGWIKIYRSLKKHWVWQDDKYFKMWIDFLFRANHQDNKILIDSDLIPISRGSFITSLKKLAKEYKCSIGRIRHFLKILENDSMIELITTHKYTQITLCNYDSYQHVLQTERNGNETGMKSERHGNETDKELKNDKNDKNKKGVEYFEDLFLLYLPEFVNKLSLETWKEWVDYRHEIKKKLTKKMAEKQLKFLILQTDPTECINQTIRNGWQGLFETKDIKAGDNIKSTGRVVRAKETQDFKKVIKERDIRIEKEGKWDGKIQK